MKEKDVRERVEMFLRSTVRTLVVPASMGLGLTLIGCSGSSSESRADAAADTPIRFDSAVDATIRLDAHLDTSIPLYSAVDAPIRLDTRLDTPIPFDSAMDTPIRLDTSADIRKWDGLPPVYAEYGVPFKLDTNRDYPEYRPDAPTDLTNSDSRPDNAPDASLVERWETQPSDASDVPSQDATIDSAVSD